MENKRVHWKMHGKEANTVLEGAEVKIPINSSNYEDIFIDRDIINALYLNRDSFYKVFRTEDTELNRALILDVHLSYIPKNGTYYIGFDYKDIFERLLHTLAVEDDLILGMKLPNKIESTEEFYSFLDEVKRTITLEKELRKEYPQEIPNTICTDEVLNRLSDNLKELLKGLVAVEYKIKKAMDLDIAEEESIREGEVDIASRNHEYISWKNLMYYTSIKALNIFEDTKNLKYYRYAKNYYINASKDRNSIYPNGLNVDGVYYHPDFSNFNNRFVEVRKKSFPDLLIRLGIEDKDKITRTRVLKNGKGMKVTISENPKPRKKLNFPKISAALDRKLTFYSGLSGKVQGIINGLDTDTDYLGYVLNNNYVAFDKFFEITCDGTRIKPAYGNRVYIATLDVLEECNYDRSKLRTYIKEHSDNKAFKFNHNDKDSYQKRIEEVTKLEDVSKIKYKELKLLHESK